MRCLLTFNNKMKIIILIAVLLSLASASGYNRKRFCGRVINTNACQLFWSRRHFDFHRFESVDMMYCADFRGIAACLNPTTVETTTSSPVTDSTACGTVCTSKPTVKLCTYKVGASTDLCRYFRNQCELENFNCNQTQPIYKLADESRCSNLTTNNEDGACF